MLEPAFYTAISRSNSQILPVRRSRSSISRKRKSFVERFLFTFGTKKGFKRLKKATQNLFAFVSMIVVGVAGGISLIGSMLGRRRQRIRIASMRRRSGALVCLVLISAQVSAKAV
jgi:hypothetical protein